MRLDGQEMDSLVTMNQRVWRTAERGDLTTDSEGNSDEELYGGADKSLARPGRKQATFLAFYGTLSFITTFTRVHHLSLPQTNQSIPLPITLLTGAACLLPGRAKHLTAPRYCVERVK